MDLLTRDEILAAQDIRTQDVEVPEWGGSVRVSVMSGTARDRYESSLVDVEGKYVALENLRARFVSVCVVDDAGAMVFTTDDIKALGEKSADALDRVFKAASRLNGTGISGLEDAAKN